MPYGSCRVDYASFSCLLLHLWVLLTSYDTCLSMSIVMLANKIKEFPFLIHSFVSYSNRKHYLTRIRSPEMYKWKTTTLLSTSVCTISWFGLWTLHCCNLFVKVSFGKSQVVLLISNLIWTRDCRKGYQFSCFFMNFVLRDPLWATGEKT